MAGNERDGTVKPQSFIESLEEIRKKLEAFEPQAAASEVRSLLYGHAPLKLLELQKLEKVLLAGPAPSGAIKRVKIALLGGYTTQPLRTAIRCFLFAEGYIAETYETGFDAYRMELLDPTSGLHAFAPEVALFATGSVNLPFLHEHAQDASVAESFLAEQARYWKLARDAGAREIIQHNFEPLDEESLGRLEGSYDWSPSRLIQNLNDRLAALDGREVVVLDVFRLACRIGVNSWFQPRWYHFGKFGFSPDYAADYGRLFAGTFRAMHGKAKKCLITDLDNTLWKGVIGDDGLHGIHLGSGTPEGEAHLAFCRYLKKLKNRGVLLAVCSKNDPAIAAEVFTSRPEMPLKIQDFVAFHCGWGNKGAMIEKIAKELNIGTDSLVFVDDNPVECAEVRAHLPEVTVVELAGDPSSFVRRLDRLRLFDQMEITSEDRRRSDSYLANRAIAELREESTNISDFLRDLRMTSKFRPVDPQDVERVEQLFAKTNQFNLNGRKFGREELTSMIGASDRFALSFWLDDKFTGYGLVSALVASQAGGTLKIENWVMSCRVFSRTLEDFVVSRLVNLARERSLTELRAELIPSAKNSYAKEALRRLGFAAVEGTHEWRLALGRSEPELTTFVASAPFA